MLFAEQARAQIGRYGIVSKKIVRLSEKDPGYRSAHEVECEEDKRTSDSSVFFDCFDDLLKAVDPQSFICSAILTNVSCGRRIALGTLHRQSKAFFRIRLSDFDCSSVRQTIRANISDFYTNVE